MVQDSVIHCIPEQPEKTELDVIHTLEETVKAKKSQICVNSAWDLQTCGAQHYTQNSAWVLCLLMDNKGN